MYDIVISCALRGIEERGAKAALAELAAAMDRGVAALVPAKLKAARKSRAVEDAKDLKKAIASLSDGSFSLAFGRDRNAFFDGVAGDAYASLNFGCAGRSPLLSDEAFEGFARASAEFADDRGAKVVIGSYSCLSVRNLGYPRTRPPRDYLAVDQSSLVDIVDFRSIADGSAADAARALREGSLPKGVKRTFAGEIAILDWSNGAAPRAEDRIAESLTRRDMWFAEQDLGQVAEGWTAQGDAIVDPVGGQPHEGLTLYSPPTGIGYVAVHSTTAPGKREEALRAAAALVAKGKTKPGASLSRVIVVADSREAALALQAEVVAAGLDKVVYATDEHFLDPSPEGNWI